MRCRLKSGHLKPEKNIQFLLLFLCMTLIFASTCSDVHAAGRLIVKPFVTPGWRYDSNYYKTATDEHAVYTYSIKPGITAGYETPKTRIALTAALDVQDYHDEDEGLISADDEDYTGHLLTLNGESRVSDRLSIGLDEQYIKSRDPANSDDYNNATERRMYKLNRVSPKLIYRFGEKFGVLTSYTNKTMDYDLSDAEDSTENRGKLDFFYNFNTRYSLDLDYQVWSRDYDKTTSDYTSNQVMLNMTRKYKYFAFTGGAGYHNRSFDNEGLDDIDLFTWRLAVDGRSDGAIDSTEPARSSMMLALSSNLNDLGTSEQYYTATRVDARFSHIFLEKLETSLKGYYQNSNYERVDRDDDTWNIAAELKYMMKEWLTLWLESGYENRDSNYADKNYDGVYVMLSAEFKFNLGAR